eukprot:513525-Rhodomonas_salina.1
MTDDRYSSRRKQRTGSGLDHTLSQHRVQLLTNHYASAGGIAGKWVGFSQAGVQSVQPVPGIAQQARRQLVPEQARSGASSQAGP